LKKSYPKGLSKDAFVQYIKTKIAPNYLNATPIQPIVPEPIDAVYEAPFMNEVEPDEEPISYENVYSEPAPKTLQEALVSETPASIKVKARKINEETEFVDEKNGNF
jgi:hypothetical protein